MDRTTAIKAVSDSLTAEQVKQLTKLDQDVKEVESFAHEYDFFPEIKGNGFRTFVKIIDSYFGSLIALKDNAFMFGQLQEMIPALVRQADIMKLARAKKYDDRTSFTDADDKIVQKSLSFPIEEIKPFYGPLEGFYLPPTLAAMYANFMALPVVAMLDMEQKVKLFSDDADNWTVMRDCKVQSWGSVNLEQKKQFSGMAFRFANMLLKDMLPKMPGIERKEFSIPSLTEWRIENPGLIMAEQPQKYPVKIHDDRKKSDKNPVEVVYITPVDKDGKVSTKDESIIIHYHGGGFVLMHPREHASYLSLWSQKLGVPVLSPNYRKAPENKFPAGLQDCLDTYLFVTSGRPEVKELLGFHPKKVLLTGDSAGGNLAPSVTIALNEIRRNYGKDVVKMPTAIVVQYPYSDPTTIMTPSEALTPICPILGPRPFLTMKLAYPPTGILFPRDDWFEREEEIRTQIRMIAPSFKEPLINNLAYTRFDELAEVPFYANVCEFDPLLDEGLMICKKWPNAKADLVNDIHGWCLFGQYATHKDKIDQMLSRMTEALNITV